VPQTFTFDDLRTILVDRIGVPEDNIVNDPAATFEDMGLDSLALVDVQLAVQQEYDFVIPDEDADGIGTVGDAIDYVNRRLDEKEA
jgi:acyl carrier protein